jgi:hypothetical protein
MNTSATPITDALTAAVSAQLPAELRWQIEGWAQHLRAARHANHAANSWAKHALEFGRISREAELVVVARCADFGMPATGAVLLIRERLAARAEKAAA